jgi:predicted molibdopterin-dependent oxidoreductase YjgC
MILVAPSIGHPYQARRDAAALATLAALTGHLGKPGSGLLPLLPRSNAHGAYDMGVTQGYLPGRAPAGDPSARQRLCDLWGQQTAAADGLDAGGLLQSVRGLIVLADDPPSVLPIGQRAMAALARTEFLAVLDAFETPTSKIAHAVLPIACFAETEGTITNMEGRVQEIHAAADPPGEARSAWQALADLCARFDVGVSYNSAADVFKEIGFAAPRYAQKKQGTPDIGRAAQRADDFDGRKYNLRAAGTAKLPTDERPTLLVRDGVFDWGSDPLVSYSPTLSRDSQSQRKLFPKGFVEIGKPYADELGIPVGRLVRLTSANGQAVLPVRLRPGLKSGLLVVPYAFRDHVAAVLGADGVTAVRLEQA